MKIDQNKFYHYNQKILSPFYNPLTEITGSAEKRVYSTLGCHEGHEKYT